MQARPALALKLATGAGKTTVMAMLIAWQTINAESPQTPKGSKAASGNVGDAGRAPR